MKFIKFLLLVCVVSLFLPVQTGFAQSLPGIGSQSSAAPATAQELPTPLTPETVRDLVSRLSDDQVRAMLLDRLDAVAQEQAIDAEPSDGLITELSQIGTGLLARWGKVIRDLPTIFSSQGKAFANFYDQFPGSGIMWLVGLTALALAIGFAAERAALLGLNRWFPPRSSADGTDLRSAVVYLFGRFGREFLGLLVFFIFVRFVGARLLDSQQLMFAAPFLFYLIWIPRVGAAVSRMLLAPQQPDMRIVNIDDHWAKYLHRHLIGLFLLIGVLLFIIDFDLKTGLTTGEIVITFWLNLGIHIYLAYVVWQARAGLTDMMRGTDPDRTAFDEKVAVGFPYFAIFVSIATWFAVEVMVVVQDSPTLERLRGGAHYVTMFWLLAAPVIDTAIRGIVRHLQPPMSGEGDIARAAYVSTKRSYIRIGRMVAVVFVVLMIANAWDIDLRDLVSSRVGDTFGANLIQFVLTLGIGYVLYELMSVWVNRRLAREQTQGGDHVAESGGEGGAPGQSRLATVLPLMLISGQVAIAVIFGLLAVGALGIDIAPLLAGAGILGLAIGFGAQKLVTDIVSGVFFLIDDAFRVGEYVDVGGTMGAVEKISIRSMQLRHHRGLVHTIPYGGIEKVTNFSRDWVIMKLMFTVPFDTDPNQVKKIFKKIGAEMMEDPLFKDDFLEPFKSQGVFQFDDVGIVMRGKFMAKPGKQFTIRKEIYNRVRNEFAANGIEFARREVRVAIPGLEDHDDLTDEQKTAVAGAVSGAVQAQVEEENAAAEANKK
ncbi:mechanosensitive ion channel family protein [Tateyamaria pelophila]|uniref:mechanosensitive ion channel family protein n=1 Tax=Tateyamaria pelophila TaxID=328415 RepID=UPI001CBACD3A|nr:mechanosensitive ion channel family protein [Tateyamaria pelophila]